MGFIHSLFFVALFNFTSTTRTSLLFQHDFVHSRTRWMEVWEKIGKRQEWWKEVGWNVELRFGVRINYEMYHIRFVFRVGS